MNTSPVRAGAKSSFQKSNKFFFGHDNPIKTTFFNPKNTIQAKCTDCEKEEQTKPEGNTLGNILLNESEHSPTLRSGMVARGTACPSEMRTLIETGRATANGWVASSRNWFDQLRTLLLARARLISGSTNRYATVSIGSSVSNRMQLLRRHFNFQTAFRPYPTSSRSRYNIQQFGQIYNSTRPIRNAFNIVRIPDYSCQDNCPQQGSSRITSDVLGSAVAGGRHFVIYSCFRGQSAKAQAGVVLHEAFHASFNSFNHDTYSFQSSYPGRNARTNAESYANFAAIVATNSGYRVIEMAPIRMTGRIPSSTPPPNTP